jgi:hypothetical protein
MNLPRAPHAQIAPAKIQQYLLSPSHPIGRAKARFFRRLGFTATRWEELRDALLLHARRGDATTLPAGAFGQRYVVRGILQGPRDRAAVLSVWIVLTDVSDPVFVTAYPEDTP